MKALERDIYQLSSGRIFSANCGVIAISPELGVSDGGVRGIVDIDWTPAERTELADFMINLWERFKVEVAMFPTMQCLDRHGRPLAGGSISICRAGTVESVRVATTLGGKYCHQAVPLNEAGLASVFIEPNSGPVKIMIRNKTGDLVTMFDNVKPVDDRPQP